MGSIGDVYQLIDIQDMEGQEVQNVYFYRLDTPVIGNAAQFTVEAFIDTVLPDILPVQAANITHTSITAKNLFDPTEEYTELISSPGTAGTDSMSTFNAIGFRLIGSNAAVRDGAKRYAGILDGAQEDGVINDSGTLANLLILGTTLAAGLAIGLDIDALIPVIVQRILVGGNYELPTTQGDAVLSPIIDALFNVNVTSQTSRKIGVGA